MTTTGGVFGRFAAGGVTASGSGGACEGAVEHRTSSGPAMRRARTPTSGSVRWPRRSSGSSGSSGSVDELSRTGGTARAAELVDAGAFQVARLRELAGRFLSCERLGADDPIRAGLEYYLASWSSRGGLHKKRIEDELERATCAKRANTAELWVLALAGRVLIEGDPIGLRMIGSRDWKLDPERNGFRAALEGADGDRARHDSFDAHIARDAAMTVAEVLRLLPARRGL